MYIYCDVQAIKLSYAPYIIDEDCSWFYPGVNLPLFSIIDKIIIFQMTYIKRPTVARSFIQALSRSHHQKHRP